MFCLAHDVEGGDSVAGGLGGEPRAQRVPSKAGPGDGTFQDRAYRFRVQPGSPNPVVAVHLPERRSGFEVSGLEPEVQRGDRGHLRAAQLAGVAGQQERLVA